MKNCIFLFFLCTLILNAQNSLPGPLNLKANGNLPLTAIEQDNMIIGGWWGHDLRVSDNMRFNLVQSSIGANFTPVIYFTSLLNVQHNDNYTYDQIKNKSKMNLVPSISAFCLTSQSFQFEPRLKITQDNIDNFTGIDDNEYSIWGFKDIHVTTIDDSRADETVTNQNNKKFLFLDKNDQEYLSHNNKVLENPWPNTLLTRLRSNNELSYYSPDGAIKYGLDIPKEVTADVIDYLRITPNNNITDNYNFSRDKLLAFKYILQSSTTFNGGKFWFLTINLKLLENLAIPESTVILKIKMPFKRVDAQTGFIKFANMSDISKNPYLNTLKYWDLKTGSNTHIKFDDIATNGYFNIIPEEIDFDSELLKTGSNYDFRLLELQRPSKSSASRGKQFIYDPGDLTTDFLITYGMIKNFLNDNITISAFFYCGLKEDEPKPNPFPRNESIVENTDIDEFGLDVYYYGNINLAIDNIRIENPDAFLTFRGYHDIDFQWYIERLVNYINSTSSYNTGELRYPYNRAIGKESFTDYYTPIKNLSENYNLFRIYNTSSNDATTFFYWNTEGYLNRLFPGLLVRSIGPEYSDRFNYHVQPKNKWVILPSIKEKIAAPYYYVNGSSNVTKNFATESGINGINSTIDINFIKNSGYETWLRQINGPLPNNIIQLIRHEDFEQIGNSGFLSQFQPEPTTYDEFYRRFMVNSVSFQANWEYANHSGMYRFLIDDGRVQNKEKFLFQDNKWWSQLFVISQWKDDPPNDNTTTQIDWFRPPTGEENSLGCNISLMLGAKGLVYDRQSVHWHPGGPGFICNGIADSYIHTDQNNQNGHNGYLDEIYHKEITTTDWAFVKENALGDEWLGTDQFNNLINLPDELSEFYNYFNVNSTRVPFMTNSKRFALKKIHDWAMDNNETLMNLRLISWYSKGFRIWQVNRDGFLDAFANIVKLPEKDKDNESEISLKLRPVDRTKTVKDNLGNDILVPYFEPPDSTFYDVTLLQTKDSQGNWTPLDNVFYIGVVNKRTDPNIIKDDEDGPGIHFSDNNIPVDFFTTAEFNEGVTTGKHNKNKDWWQLRWWKRLGCREITIPLNLGPEHRNKLIKVTEITRSIASIQAQHEYNSTTLSENEINELYPTVNKVIGYDGTITAKFLPGEGKLFKCEILEADDILKGDLAHSNQNKMVVTPVYDAQGQETPMVQYHLTYTYPVTIDGVLKNRVLYNRSEPIDKTSLLSNIKWQTASIRRLGMPSQDPIPNGYVVSWDMQDELGNLLGWNVNCEYPSIVVKKEGTKNIAYIAYQCDGVATNPDPAIFYSRLDVNEIGISQDYNRKLENISYGNENSSHWGNPVINSSAEGNFIVWSTATTSISPFTSAIVSKFAYTGILPNFSASYYIHQPEFDNWFSPTTTWQKHPSVNVFSNYSINECSVVWQSAYYNDDPYYSGDYSLYNKILYSRLRLGTNGIELYLPTFEPSMMNYASRSFNYNSNITMLDSRSRQDQCSFPVIYRRNSGLKPEYIYYQNFENWLQYIQLFATSNNFHASERHKIRSSYWWLNPCSQPTIAQSSGMIFDGVFEKPAGSYVLDFKFGSDIYQFVKPMNLITSNFKLNERFYTLRNAEIGGNQPHLASSLIYNSDDNTWKNRRVFVDNDGNNTILSTANYFYAYHPEDKIAENYIGFNSDTSHFMINLPKLGSSNAVFNRPYEYIYAENDSAGVLINKDTLWSDVLQIYDDTLQIIQSSKDTGVKIYLVYQDNYKVELTCPNTMIRSNGILMRYNLIMGNGNLFRLMIINKDTSMRYNEDIIIDGLDVIDTIDITMNLQRSIANSVPDVKQVKNSIILEVTPVPAKDIVYVSARLPEGTRSNNKTDDIIIKLISFDGKDLLSVLANSGVTKSISLEKFAQGIFFIRAEVSDIKLRESVLPTARQIVIER